MYCSAEEIERKRQEALKKLASKKNPSSPIRSYAPISKEEPAKIDPPGVSSPFKRQSGGSAPLFKKKPYDRSSPSSSSNFGKNVNGIGSNKVTTSIHLISSQRICVKMSSYCQSIIDNLKTVPTKSYDPQTRTWNFHIKDYDNVLSKIKGQNTIIEPLPRFVINSLKDSDSLTEIDTTRMDSTLVQTLLPFQLDGLQFGIHRGGRCLIADDMGLGKTFQALAIMNYYKRDWPLLIVTTASMKNVWEETILKYIPSVPVTQVQYMMSGKDYIGDSTVLIISHDLMSRCYEKLLERGFFSIIIDESHNLKNYKAKITQAAIKLCKRARRVVLLSGTPALSRPKELYSQLCLIDEKFFGTFIDYAKRYCDLQQTNFGLDSSGKSNLQELEIVLKNKFMIRRTKDDVLGSLPKKQQEVIKLNINRMGNEDKELMENLSSQITSTNKGMERHAILLTFFSETAKIKIPAVCSHINKILSEKKKFLVFAHHRVMLDAIEMLLKHKSYKYIRIDGSTSSDQRKYLVDKFQTDETCLCAVLSITAANAGITLTAAHEVVFAELHWNPSILSQAEARVHRLGQENTVLVQYLLADGTADDYIWPMLQEKQNILQEMGLTKDTFSNVHQKVHTTRSIKDCFNSLFNINPECSKDDEIQEDDDSVLDDGFDDVLCSIDL